MPNTANTAANTNNTPPPPATTENANSNADANTNTNTNTNTETEQKAIERFAFPFPPKDAKKGTGQYMEAWASTGDGFYPLGNNGQFHGGIHFDSATGGALKLSEGVKCIADGEVVAYRVNREDLTATYGELGAAKYSNGFVLVRHKLQVPKSIIPPPAPAPAPANANANANANAPIPANSNSTTPSPPAADTTASATVAESELPFAWIFSLYMHLSSYEEYDKDGGATMETPKFWKVNPLLRRAGSRAVGAKPNWVPVEEMEEKGVNVRAGGAKTAALVAWLPQGARITLKPGTGEWREIESATPMYKNPTPPPIAATPQATNTANTPNVPANTANPASAPAATETFWVNDTLLSPEPGAPEQFDDVYILPEPYKIKAGELVGHMGNYQRYKPEAINHAKDKRPLSHVEIISDYRIEYFIEKCRELAKNAPDSEKTLLKIDKGAKLVLKETSSDSILSVGDGYRIRKETKQGNSPWVKVERGTFQTVAKETLKGGSDKTQSYSGGELLYSASGDCAKELTATEFVAKNQAERESWTDRTVFKPNGAFVWVEQSAVPVSFNNLNKIVKLEKETRAWKAFPLQLGKEEGAACEYGMVAGMKGTKSVTDNEGKKWYKVSVPVKAPATNTDKPPETVLQEGWARESEHPGVEAVSPWSWPNFETVKDGIDLPYHWVKGFFEGKFDKPANPVLKALFDVIDEDKSGDLTVKELQDAYKKPWLAQILSRKVVRNFSEWSHVSLVWDMLDEPLKSFAGKKNAPSPDAAWLVEKARISTLMWFDSAKAIKNFPKNQNVFHLHPLAMVENFGVGCSCKTLTPELLLEISPSTPPDKAELYVPIILAMYERYGITSCLGKAHILAQMLHESTYFKNTRECGTLAQLQQLHPDYYPHIGRGLIQLTHKATYKDYGTYATGNRYEFTTENAPWDWTLFKKLEDLPYCVDSAGWFWTKYKPWNLENYGKDDDFIFCTAVVNGGFNHYEERLKLINKIIQTLGLQSHLKKNINGIYRVEDSYVYNKDVYIYIYARYCDPAKIAFQGITKNTDLAINAYKRFLEIGTHQTKRQDATNRILALGGVI